MGKFDLNAKKKEREAKEATIPDVMEDSPLAQAYQAVWGSDKESVHYIELSKIVPFVDNEGKGQPFKLNPEKVEQIKFSARDIGIITPLIVRKRGEMYQIISGHHRYEAAKELELLSVPCLVRDVKDEEATLLVVESNIQRMKLCPSEYGAIFCIYLAKRKDMDMSVQEIAGKFGISKKTMYRYANVSKLIHSLQELFDNDTINLDCSDIFVKFSERKQECVAECIGNAGKHITMSVAIAMQTIADEISDDDITTDDFNIVFAPKVKPAFKNKIYTSLAEKYNISDYTEKDLDNLVTELLEEHFSQK